jgi:hypothetical protein
LICDQQRSISLSEPWATSTLFKELGIYGGGAMYMILVDNMQMVEGQPRLWGFYSLYSESVGWYKQPSSSDLIDVV